MLTLTFCLAGLAADAHARPVHIRSHDPLSETPPAAIFRGFAPSSVVPELKLTQDMWKKAVPSNPSQEMEIIVTLVEPLEPALLSVSDPAIEEDRLEQLALLEHDFARSARDLGFKVTRGLSHFPIVSGRINPALLLKLAALPHVRAIEPVQIFKISRADGGALIKATQLHTQLGGSGAGVDIAVVDTGISFTHPEVAPNLEVQGDYTNTTGNGNDDNGHGTSAAGIIAGVSQGMAPQADLWAIKVLKANGSSTATSVLAGLNALFAARNDFGGLDIVNMSLGSLGPGNTPFNSDCDLLQPAFATIINQFVAAGISVFAASGNEGCLAGVGSPACLSNVISVGAVYDANVGPQLGWLNVSCSPSGTCDNLTTAADLITCYSNSGIPLDILAPSHCAHTPSIGTSNNTCFGGTSAASPYAAGVAAQIRSLLPATTPAQLRQAFMTTGKPLTDVNGIIRNRIDAVAAFQALGGSGNNSSCIRDADTACLQGDRFEVNITWTNNQGGGAAQVMSFGGQRTENNEAAFYYFQSAANFEMGVKLLNACVPFFGNKFWVFISGLTDQGWSVNVRDTQTGAIKTYSNPIGKLSTTFADTAAFNCQ
jgi:subtilisin family serine protease